MQARAITGVGVRYVRRMGSKLQAAHCTRTGRLPSALKQYSASRFLNNTGTLGGRRSADLRRYHCLMMVREPLLR